MRIGYLLGSALAIPVILEIIWWFAMMMVAIARGKVSRCPRCVSTCTRPSRRGLTDVFFPAFILPLRCENCDRRFFSLQSVNYVRPRSPAPALARGERASRRSYSVF